MLANFSKIINSLFLLPRKIVVFFIKTYQKTFSPDHGILKGFFPRGYCRFTPSCSQYGVEAIEKYGVIKGGLMTSWRIIRCNPFNKGGYDPVK
jgi:uncharacterized protein